MNDWTSERGAHEDGAGFGVLCRATRTTTSRVHGAPSRLPGPAVHRDPAAPGATSAHARAQGRLATAAPPCPGAAGSKASELPALLQGQPGAQRGAGQPSSCFPVGEPFRKAAFFPECQGWPLSEAQSLHGEAGRPRRARGVTQSPKPAGGSHGKDPGLEERGQGHIWALGDRLLSSEMPPRGSHPRGLPTPGPDTAFNGGVHVTSLL